MQHNTKHDLAKGGAYPSGRKSRKAFVTVNERYGRIYFSAFAARIFNLVQNRFDIFQQEGSWFFKISNSPQAMKLTSHRYAFYRVDRKLVTDLIKSFPVQNPLRLSIEDAERPAPMYLLSTTDGGPGNTTRNRTTGGPQTSVPQIKARSWRDHQMNEALNKIAFYKMTDFRGRVKTLEVIRAERIINAKH